ncbi:MAG: aspartate/glutamate racemase family protein [Proteobacteria bacterium]|nr:aspartate/glutamate racemase family protein [Pseudomonadota bacterium]
MYGWRARIGMLIPSVNTTMEYEMWRLLPEGVAFQTTRFETGAHGTADVILAMEETAQRAARILADGRPDVAVFGCTSGSFFEGPGWDKRMSSRISEIVKAPCVTTSGAMVAALQANGIRKVDVVTPYVQLTNERLKAFLQGNGIEVVRLATFDMLDLFDHAAIEPHQIYRRAKETASGESDGVFIACTQLKALPVIEALERDLGKPVYSANQVSVWQAFDVLGLAPEIDGYGSLLRGLRERRAPAARLRRAG